MAGLKVVQLASYVDLIFASLLAVGGVAALTYAQVIYLLPISLFGMSVAAAELPTLSTMDHGDRAQVISRLDDGLGRVAFFVVPSMIAFVLVGDLVVATLYQGRNFTASDAVQVGAILALYSFGLIASTSSRLLQSALYGVGDTRNPAVYAVLRVVLSTAIGVALMFPLDAIRAGTEGFALVGDLTWQIAPEELRSGTENRLRMGAAGLAIGASIGAWFEWFLLRARIRLVFARPRLGGPYAGRIVLAGGVESLSDIPILHSRRMSQLLVAASKAKTLGQRLKLFAQVRPCPARFTRRQVPAFRLCHQPDGATPDGRRPAYRSCWGDEASSIPGACRASRWGPSRACDGSIRATPAGWCSPPRRADRSPNVAGSPASNP